MQPTDPCFLSHNSSWHARAIVKDLNALGYIVDIVDYRDQWFVPRNTYNLFIGHGGINFDKISTKLPARTQRLYFSSGCYWKYHNAQELARFDDLAKRKGTRLPLDRFNYYSEENALLASQGIIGFGNQFTCQTYAKFDNVHLFNQMVLPDNHYENSFKDFETGSSHFLYFAGGGCVHKGLDLLLEAFTGLEQHLWISAIVEDGFGKLYKNELFNQPNIHPIGWTQLYSEPFYEIMEHCNFIILPSCSEGMAGSVVEGMNQGLIPIVSRASGLDVDSFGTYLETCTISEIRYTIQLLSALSPNECTKRSKIARQVACEDFSENAFLRNFTSSIQLALQEY
jgi:glycosyltransferase involved in cell wall biosynthesis